MPGANSTIRITLEAVTDKANATFDSFFKRFNGQINSANARRAQKADNTADSGDKLPKGSSDAKDQAGFIDNLNAKWTQFYNTVANTSKDLANLMVSPFEGLREGMDKSLNQWLLKGASAKQFFNGVAIGILSSMRKAFAGMASDFATRLVMMAVQWAAQQTGMTALFTAQKQAQAAAATASQATSAAAGKAIAAAAVAAQLPLAVASAAMWSPAATLATIATFGAAAVAAPGLIAAAEGTTLGLSSFAEGGFTGSGSKDEVAGLVHRGEFVVPAERVNQVGLGFFEAIRSGRFSAASISAASAPHTSDFQQGPGNSVIQHKTELSLATFGGEADAKRWAEGQDGETWFLDMMNKHAYRYTQQG